MIEVLQTGAQSSLQDAGRPGLRHLGIPGSGAADKLSFALANWTAGNAWDLPAIECTLGGQQFRFHKESQIGVAGADMSAQINGKLIKNFAAYTVKKGDILTFSAAKLGCRAYLAVAGGFSGESFMSSMATYTPASVGGVDGRALKSGDRFETKGCNLAKRVIPVGYAPVLANHIVLRSRPGPEYFDLSLASQRHLFISPFYSTQQTDRMGTRLKGDKLTLQGEHNMVSSPMLTGTLQVPPDGGPILALVDGHCTGGYARAVQVIKADYWLMGQIGPGMPISFQRCFADDAPKILQRRNAFYGGLIDGFEF